MIAGFSTGPGAPVFWFRCRGIQVFSTTRAMQRDDAATITDPERCVAVCAVQNIHGHSGADFRGAGTVKWCKYRIGAKAGKRGATILSSN